MQTDLIKPLQSVLCTFNITLRITIFSVSINLLLCSALLCEAAKAVFAIWRAGVAKNRANFNSSSYANPFPLSRIAMESEGRRAGTYSPCHGQGLVLR